MFCLQGTFCLNFFLINIHIFDYPDSRLSGLFTEVPTSPDNRGATVLNILFLGFIVKKLSTLIAYYLIN